MKRYKYIKTCKNILSSENAEYIQMASGSEIAARTIINHAAYHN